LIESFVSSSALPEFSLWDKLKEKRAPISFDLEITARCNNDCRHCYINLPAADSAAKNQEITFEGIATIADEAASMGCIWCLLTGGEPLLREDFSEIYHCLKRRGLLVSVFTNAALINEEHVELFRKYPPRDVEVSVYGVTKETYERVTRKKGSFDAFMRGLNLLQEGGVKVRLKAMAIRSNAHELPEIARFCRQRSKDYFRFDPFLHLRYDGNWRRNEEIKSERLSPEEIVAIERDDQKRFQALEKGCDKLIVQDFAHLTCRHLFHCGTGNGSFGISYDGVFRPCSSLYHPECTYDLKKGKLSEAWRTLIPKVRTMESRKQEFLVGCHVCPLANLCMWCPARAYLETGELDAHVEYFCNVAHARAEALQHKGKTL
jgi:radical SAM protein with 4Fe4S-binding SPASM domain